MRPKLGLKTHYYLSLAWRNPWLFMFSEPVRNYVRYKLTPHRVVIDTRKVAPVFCTISVTQRCNLSCSFCIVGDWINEPTWRDNEATVTSMSRLLAHPVVRRSLYIMLTGGEPLLNREIVPIVRLIKSHRHLLAMTSNGTLLKDRIEDLRSAGLDLINLSLYDTNKDALANVLPVASKRLYCKLVKIIGRRAVETPGLIEECVRFARETGCRRIYFQNMLPVPHNSKTARRARKQRVRSKETDARLPVVAAAHAGTPVSGGVSVATLPDSPAPLRTSLTALPDSAGLDTEPIYDDNESYPRIKEDITRRYPDVSISWPAPVPRVVQPHQKRCRMPWYSLIIDMQGNQGFCCAHATCNGPNIHEMPADQVLNTREWTDTRRDLLSADSRIPDMCRECFMLSDSWSSEM